MTGGRQRTVVVTTTSDPERRSALAGLVAASAVAFESRPRIADDTAAVVLDGPDAVAGLSVDHVERWVTVGDGCWWSARLPSTTDGAR